MAAQSNDNDDLITGINVTPLVDIILVLLIIFMVTSEVIHEREAPTTIDIDLPAAASGEKMLSKGLLNLVIDGAGQLYLNGKKADLPALKSAISITRKTGIKAQALISADQRTPHGRVVKLMDWLRIEGVRDIAINTAEQEIE